MQNESWVVPGAPVEGYLWQAPSPKAAVLLSHGFGEYAGRYVERYHRLIPTLVDAGYSVYAYDHRSHGKSPGRPAVTDLHVLVDDHLKAREALRAQALPVFALGHSMGGLVTAASATRDPRGLRGVILSSPALLVGEQEPAWLTRLAPLIARVAPGLKTSDLGTGGLSRLPDEVAAYEADPAMYHGNVPALTAASMLHGTEDRITDPRGSQRFHDTIAATDKTLHAVEGGYHELLNDEPREAVRQVILDWLRARTG